MIALSVDLRGLGYAFSRLRRFSEDLRPAWRELRKPVRADQRDHRKEKQGPAGPWAPRAESTMEAYRERRQRGRKPPRGLLGRLPAALITKIERKRMIVESRVKWSGIHQDGGTAGHGAKIPARPFLWVSQQLADQVASVVSAMAKKVWESR